MTVLALLHCRSRELSPVVRRLSISQGLISRLLHVGRQGGAIRGWLAGCVCRQAQLISTAQAGDMATRGSGSYRQARGWAPPELQFVAARPYPLQYVSFSRPRTDSRVGM